ncbi:MAG: alpha,6-mannosyltransferase, partial [Acidimicrobiaceae bacterium]
MVGTVEAEQPRRAPRRRLRELGPYPIMGFVGALLVAGTTPLWYLSGRAWRLTLPGLPHDGQRPVTAIVFVSGVTLVGVGWIGLIGRAERAKLSERDRTWAVVFTAALWFAPVLLGPPLLSSDIYSYAAEGAMVTNNLDPTAEGMYKLQFTPDTGYAHHVDTTWRKNGNPYGPVQMGVAAGVVTVTGHNFSLTIWGLRLVSVLGVALAAWGVHEIARRSGVSPPVALAFAIANPIVVFHIVGGGHNEGLLMGLLSVGCALALKGRWWFGVVLIALAAGVKLPAAA